jgi:hypothetical protein
MSPARAIRPLVFLDQLAARSLERPRDHRTAGVDVLPSVGLNSLYELTDNFGSRGCNIRSRPKNHEDRAHNIVPNDLDLGVRARCKFSVLAA